MRKSSHACAAAGLILVVAFAAGCSHLIAGASSGEGASEERRLPFHSNDSPNLKASSSPADDNGADKKKSPKIDSMPFSLQADRTIPAGTLITVRLRDLLSSGRLGTDGEFAGIVDEPIAADGVVLISRGAAAHGRIEAARASTITRGTGYLRLALDSITTEGKQIPVETSSLFARGKAFTAVSRVVSSKDVSRESGGMNSKDENGSEIVRLPQGRLLTFRLTATLVVPATVSRSEEKMASGSR